MAKSRLMYAGLLLTLVAVPAFAQTANTSATGAVVGTDASQQQEIENGLKDGQLDQKEAGRAEHGEQRIDHIEARDLKKDGSSGLTQQQETQIDKMQTNEQNRINHMDSNNVHGDPDRPSNERMQKDVQRNVNQENRIENGVNKGTLTNRETGRMEKGQAHVDRAESRAARHGGVSRREQARIQGKENYQSGRIYRAKHNDHNAPGTAQPMAAPATAQ